MGRVEKLEIKKFEIGLYLAFSVLLEIISNFLISNFNFLAFP